MEAVLEYLRSIGCREDEVMRMGRDSASWRGAVYKAVPAENSADAWAFREGRRKPGERASSSTS
jgi:hypothetical protein